MPFPPLIPQLIHFSYIQPRFTDGILKSDLYRNVFEDFSFEVQPAPNYIFTTAHKYADCTYKFKVMPSGAFIITEHNQNGMEYELLPKILLEGEVPYILHENYSHWWNKRDDCIDFRPKYFNDKLFKTEIAYKLDLKSRTLVHVKTNRQLFDITTHSYQAIVQQLERLESKQYIHVYREANETTKVELTRMHLKFQVQPSPTHDDAYELISNEFVGMRIRLQQNCGSLFGLQSGLILESRVKKTESRQNAVLLLPHGNVKIVRTDEHVDVTIDVDEPLQNPPFHRYQVDENARQIRSTNSSYSAWLYLAYLHAVTSYGEVEPLLGMSGTERALQILQSGMGNFRFLSASWQFFYL